MMAQQEWNTGMEMLRYDQMTPNQQQQVMRSSYDQGFNAPSQQQPYGMSEDRVAKSSFISQTSSLQSSNAKSRAQQVGVKGPTSKSGEAMDIMQLLRAFGCSFL